MVKQLLTLIPESEKQLKHEGDEAESLQSECFYISLGLCFQFDRLFLHSCSHLQFHRQTPVFPCWCFLFMRNLTPALTLECAPGAPAVCPDKAGGRQELTGWRGLSYDKNKNHNPSCFLIKKKLKLDRLPLTGEGSAMQCKAAEDIQCRAGMVSVLGGRGLLPLQSHFEDEFLREWDFFLLRTRCAVIRLPPRHPSGGNGKLFCGKLLQIKPFKADVCYSTCWGY